MLGIEAQVPAFSFSVMLRWPVSTAGIGILNIIGGYQQSHYALYRFDQTPDGATTGTDVQQKALPFKRFQGPRGVLLLVQGQQESFNRPIYASSVALVRTDC